MKKGSGVTQKEIRAELEDMKPSAESLAAKLPPGKPRREQLPKEESRSERTIIVTWHEKGTCAFCVERDAWRKTLTVGGGAYARQGVPKPSDYQFICTVCETEPVKPVKTKRKHVTTKKRGMNAAEEDEDD